ncbi:response regulator [Amylibacter marinus]|uniref:Response regulator n=1 Tax=Amylibacter marinus TaxID=1475483 RepID=A0ABQ5VVW2_9RHOB|nr:response regulator [Amylibacter marinus]GLQ35596.1 response regulator [Amylibacter marinus]
MSKSVAIIEDEPFIVEALTFLLERAGLTVRSFANGAGSIEFIQQVTPDLVILDIMLPNISGMEILENIRNNQGLKRLPVLMLTAKGQKRDRKAAIDAGVDLFMTKPFSNDELVASVLDLLDS